MKHKLINYQKPISFWVNLADEWIFDEMYRNVFKDHYLHGLTYSQLADRYGRSERQIATIVTKSMQEVLNHIDD